MELKNRNRYTGVAKRVSGTSVTCGLQRMLREISPYKGNGIYNRHQDRKVDIAGLLKMVLKEASN